MSAYASTEGALSKKADQSFSHQSQSQLRKISYKSNLITKSDVSIRSEVNVTERLTETASNNSVVLARQSHPSLVKDVRSSMLHSAERSERSERSER